MVYYYLDKPFYMEQVAKCKNRPINIAGNHSQTEEPPSSELPGEEIAERNHFIYQCKGSDTLPSEQEM